MVALAQNQCQIRELNEWLPPQTPQTKAITFYLKLTY